MSDEGRTSELRSIWNAQRVSILDPMRSRQVAPMLSVPVSNEISPVSMRNSHIQPQMNQVTTYDYQQPMQQQLQTKQNGWSPAPESSIKERIPSNTATKSIDKIITTKLVLGIMIGLVICGIPLGVMTTLYIQTKSSSSGTSSSSSNGSTSVSLPSQCTSYTTNTDVTRNVGYTSCGSCYCDSSLSTGWYRFSGSAGTSLITTPVSTYMCSSSYTGWFNGTFPSTAGGTTYGTVCVNYSGYLCFSSYSVSSVAVTNCSGFYVFYLTPMPNCNSRYCTT